MITTIEDDDNTENIWKKLRCWAPNERHDIESSCCSVVLADFITWRLPRTSFFLAAMFFCSGVIASCSPFVLTICFEVRASLMLLMNSRLSSMSSSVGSMPAFEPPFDIVIESRILRIIWSWVRVVNRDCSVSLVDGVICSSRQGHFSIQLQTDLRNSRRITWCPLGLTPSIFWSTLSRGDVSSPGFGRPFLKSSKKEGLLPILDGGACARCSWSCSRCSRSFFRSMSFTRCSNRAICSCAFAKAAAAWVIAGTRLGEVVGADCELNSNCVRMRTNDDFDFPL